MDVVELALIATGAVAILIGALQIRGPLATIRQLDETDANLRRYEAWRGKRTSLDADGPTGADEMKAQMRQRVILWAGVIVVGAILMAIGVLVV